MVWSTDGWLNTQRSDPALESELNLWFADFPTAEWPPGSAMSFTCLWKQDQRWHGHDWQVSLLPS
jgi:hypothetical protein